MMTLLQKMSQNSEMYTKTTDICSESASTTAKIIYFPENDNTTGDAIELDDFMAQLCEEDSIFTEQLNAAHKWVADNFYNSNNQGLTKLRLECGLTQKQLAGKMNTSQAQLSRLEAGKQDPSLSTLKKLAQALNVDITTVIGAFEVIQ